MNYQHLLNPSNKLITKEYINNLLDEYDVNDKITNIKEFINAMTHKSYCVNIDLEESKSGFVQPRLNDYERLEFLGDGIANSIVISYIYERYDEYGPGKLTNIKQKMIQSKSYAYYCKKIELNKYLLISKNLEDKYGRDYNDYCEDIFEAFIGSLYLEIGYEKTYKLFVGVIEKYTDWEDIIVVNDNYKNQLFSKYKKNGLKNPYFKQVNHTNDIYTICVYDQYKNIIGTGKGESKKIAEQKACKMALENQ